MSIVADRRLYLNKDKTSIVEEGDVEAGFLFVIPGHTISDDDAEKYGLTAEPEPEPEPEPKPITFGKPEPLDVQTLEKAEAKMAAEVENKMAEAAENKRPRRRRKRKSKD